jgi:exodeoxyribonuclease VII small subunit
MNAKAIQKLSYEKAMQRIREITIILTKHVELSETQENLKTETTQNNLQELLEVEEVCKLYEEGQLLLKHCDDLLNKAQQRIEVATEDGLVPYN